MSDVFAKNQATSAEDAAKIFPRAEFRVFGHGIIEKVMRNMWSAKAVLHAARKMPAESFKFGMIQLVVITGILILWTQYVMPVIGFNSRLW